MCGPSSRLRTGQPSPPTSRSSTRTLTTRRGSRSSILRSVKSIFQKKMKECLMISERVYTLVKQTINSLKCAYFILILFLLIFNLIKSSRFHKFCKGFFNRFSTTVHSFFVFLNYEPTRKN